MATATTSQSAARLRQPATYAVIVPILALLAYRKALVRRLTRLQKPAQTPGIPNTPALEAAQRELFKILPDGTRELMVPTNGRIRKVVVHPIDEKVFIEHRKTFSKQPPVLDGGKDGKKGKGKGEAAVEANRLIRQEGGQAAASAKRVGVNKEFFRQLRAIFMVIVPSSTSKEVGLIAVHTAFLILRTYLSLLVAKLDGIIVRDLVSADAKGFLRGLLYWYLLAVPSTYTNSMIRFLQSKLSLSFRTRLTRYIHDLYLNKTGNFYKIINLDNRIEGADQFIATDVARFCDSLSSLYSNISKPTLDLVLFNIQLGRSIGRWGSLGLMINYLLTGWILRRVMPGFGKLAAIEAKLEGDFRSAHARLITNAEEIAFYGGAQLEKSILTRAYLRLIRHVNSIFKIRIAYAMVEDWLLKYSWSAVGYCLVSLPVFGQRWIDSASRASGVDLSKVAQAVQTSAGGGGGGGESVARRTEEYISNRRLMLALADAGGRLMYSNKDLSELAGYTSRVYSLLSTLHELDASHYQSVPRPASLPASEPFYDLGHINGKVVEGEADVVGVEFDRVPIVAPAPGLERGGELLVKDLGMKVQPGQHCLITGPNGVGKTSVARVLSGLWPCFEGVVRKPKPEQIMYLPQRPYLSLGSFRDQIIYPQSYPQFIAAGGDDDMLMEILKHAHLAYIPQREGGWDTVKEWKDVLSGGEKQRVGLARLYYHCPKFGVLDECTSAVSTDVEGLLYAHAKDLGITLITISHRPSLLKYHDRQLRLGGDHGTWELAQIGTEEEELSFQGEIDELKRRLAGVDTMRRRLQEIKDELAFQRA